MQARGEGHLTCAQNQKNSQRGQSYDIKIKADEVKLKQLRAHLLLRDCCAKCSTSRIFLVE